MYRSLRLLSHSTAETMAIGAAVALQLRVGDVVVLVGDLGGGKTAFVRGAVAALGSSDPVSSPTFAIAHEYRAQVPIVHIDCYRIQRAQEMFDIGIEDLINAQTIAFVEWGDLIRTLLGDSYLEIAFELLSGPDDGPDDRVLRVTNHGAQWCDRLALIEAACIRADDGDHGELVP